MTFREQASHGGGGDDAGDDNRAYQDDDGRCRTVVRQVSDSDDDTNTEVRVVEPPTPTFPAEPPPPELHKRLCKQPSNGIHITNSTTTKNDAMNGDRTALTIPTNGETNNNNSSNNNNNTSNGHSNNHSRSNGTQQNGGVVDEELTFDPNASYYMANACCELLHYRTAAVLVGMVEIALIAAWGVLIGYYYANGDEASGAKSVALLGGQAAAAACCLVVIVLMLVGVLAEHPLLMWPHMIVQMAGIGASIALTVLAVIAMCAGTWLAELIFKHLCGEHNLPIIEKSLGPLWPFCLAVVFDFGAALGIWFYIVIKGAYEYLMDKSFFENQCKKVQTLSLKTPKF